MGGAPKRKKPASAGLFEASRAQIQIVAKNACEPATYRVCLAGMRDNRKRRGNLEFEEVLPGRRQNRQVLSGGERKTLQLCRQIERAIYFALGDACDEGLRELVVLSVEPAASSRQVLVNLACRGGETEAACVLASLRTAAPWLRGEVAAAICRRKVPELAFVVIPTEAPWGESLWE